MIPLDDFGLEQSKPSVEAVQVVADMLYILNSLGCSISDAQQVLWLIEQIRDREAYKEANGEFANVMSLMQEEE